MTRLIAFCLYPTIVSGIPLPIQDIKQPHFFSSLFQPPIITSAYGLYLCDYLVNFHFYSKVYFQLRPFLQVGFQTFSIQLL